MLPSALLDDMSDVYDLIFERFTALVITLDKSKSG